MELRPVSLSLLSVTIQTFQTTGPILTQLSGITEGHKGRTEFMFSTSYLNLPNFYHKKTGWVTDSPRQHWGWTGMLFQWRWTSHVFTITKWWLLSSTRQQNILLSHQTVPLLWMSHHPPKSWRQEAIKTKQDQAGTDQEFYSFSWWTCWGD